MAAQNNNRSSLSAQMQKEMHEENMRRIALLKETMAAQQTAQKNPSPPSSATPRTASTSRSASASRPSGVSSTTPSLRRSTPSQWQTASSAYKPQEKTKRSKERPRYTLGERLLCWNFVLFGMIAGFLWFTVMHDLLAMNYGGQLFFGDRFEEIFDGDFLEALTGLFLMGYGISCLITFIRFRGARIRSVFLQTITLAVGGCVYMLLLTLGIWAFNQIIGFLVPIILLIGIVIAFVRKPSRYERVQSSVNRLRDMENDPEVSESRKKAYARELTMAIQSDKDMLGTDVDDLDEIDSLFGG